MMSDAAFDHDPVMRDEITAVFATVPAGTVVDATLGGGGHSAALLESRDDLDVLGRRGPAGTVRRSGSHESRSIRPPRRRTG
jgi:hypothetical protein